MARYYLTILALLLIIDSAIGQNISRKTADSLLRVIPQLTAGEKNAEPALQLAMFFIRQNGANKANQDSASYFIGIAKKFAAGINSSRFKGYISLAEAQLQDAKGNQEAARKLALTSINLLKSATDKSLLGKAYYELGRCYPDYHNAVQLAHRIALVDSAVNALKNSPDKIELATDLQMLADLYVLERNYDRALVTLKWCLDVYKGIHHEKLQGVYVLYSRIYNRLTDYKHALVYGLLALKACKITGDTTAQLAQIQNNLGNIYSMLGENENAVDYYLQAGNGAIRRKDTAGINLTMQNACVTFLNMDQPYKAWKILNSITKYATTDFNYRLYNTTLHFEVYRATKNYASAGPYFVLCKTLLTDPDLKDTERNQLYGPMIDYLIETRNFEKAIPYCKLYSQYASKYSMYNERVLSFQFRYKIDSALNNYRSAFVYLQRYKQLNDSIFTENKNKQLQELQVVYQTKEKDNSIVLLNQKSKLQQDEINVAVRVRNETIAGICFLLVGGGLFTRQYRIRQKAFGIIRTQNEVITTRNNEIEIKNVTLESLVREKEYLALEIHHRVKNNLQTTMSLLNMQSANISDKKALSAIKDSQRRIHAMSLIHQRLYQSDNLGLINMEAYIKELVAHLADSFDKTGNIKLQISTQPIHLDVAIALPLGLIINEAVTNSFKYAFPDRRKGKISVKLDEAPDGLIALIIEDDGIGFAKPGDGVVLSSLGMKLMEGLTEQIRGVFEVKSDGGTKISITFRDSIIQA